MRGDMASEDFDALNDEMVRELFRLNPDAGTRFGMHDPYDGMLPHGGFTRIEQTSDLLTSWLRRAEKVAASGELDHDGEISLEVLRMSEGMLRFARHDYPLWQIFPEATEVPGGALLLMFARDYATPEEKASWMSSRIGEIPRYLEEFRTRFRPGRPAREWTAMSIASAKGLPKFLDFLDRHYNGKVSPGVDAGLSKNVARAKEATGEHLEWLVSLEEHSVPGFAMGRDNLAKLLRLRGYEQTPEEVLAACADISAYSRPSHVVILKAGEIPLNRVAKTDYLNLRQRAKAIVRATTHFRDPKIVAEVSRGLGDAMPGIETSKLPESEMMQNRGW